jgi:hypothetical protein
MLSNAAPAGAVSSSTIANSTDDWLSWIQWVAEGASKSDALRILQARVAAWPVEIHKEPSGAHQFAEQLGNASLSSSDVVQAAFPYLFEAFVTSQDAAVPSWKPIYSNLLMALALSNSRSTVL